MPVKATTHAVERSTYAVTLSLYDEVSSPVVPTSAWWSLEDHCGGIVNSRSNVPFSGGVSSIMNVILSGSDLELTDQHNEFEVRRLQINARYDSTYGIGLSLHESLEFLVYNTNIIGK